MTDLPIENTSKEEGVRKVEVAQQLRQVNTIDEDNYHGLTLEVTLVYLAISLVGFAQMMVVVGSGLLGRYIAADIGGAAKVQWFAQTNTIVTLAFTTPISLIADFWGRKLPLQSCIGISFVGSIILSRAEGMDMVLAGDALASLSVATTPLLYAIAGEIFPRRFRPVVQGSVNFWITAAAVVTLLAGTYLCKTYHEGWRIFWYINAGLFALSFVLTQVLYNPPPRELQDTLTQLEKLKRLDWIGIFLPPIGLVLFVIGLTWSDNPYDWSNAHVLAPFIMGLLILAFVIAYEWRIKKDGLFHHGLFRKKGHNFTLSLFLIFVEGAAFFGANYFFPTEMAILFETDDVRIGLRFAVVFIVALGSTMAAAIVSSKARTLRWPIVFGFLCFVIFYALMISVSMKSSQAIWAYVTVFGIGLGTVLSLLIAAAQFGVPSALISTSTGALLCLRTFGAALCLPIYNAIYNSQINKRLPADIADAVLSLGLPLQHLPAFIVALSNNDTPKLMEIPGMTPQIVEAGVYGMHKAFLASFRIMWIFPLVLSIIAVLASFLLTDPKNDFTMHVDAPIDQSVAEQCKT